MPYALLYLTFHYFVEEVSLVREDSATRLKPDPHKPYGHDGVILNVIRKKKVL